MAFLFYYHLVVFFFLSAFHPRLFSSALPMGRSFIPVRFLFSQDIVTAHFPQTGGTVGNVVLSRSGTQPLPAGVCRSDVFFPRQRRDPADSPITPPATTPGSCCPDSPRVCLLLSFSPRPELISL